LQVVGVLILDSERHGTHDRVVGYRPPSLKIIAAQPDAALMDTRGARQRMRTGQHQRRRNTRQPVFEKFHARRHLTIQFLMAHK
jgi:hypothetical protein